MASTFSRPIFLPATLSPVGARDAGIRPPSKSAIWVLHADEWQVVWSPKSLCSWAYTRSGTSFARFMDGLTFCIGHWKGVVVGVCDLWSKAKPNQNREERGGQQEIERGKTTLNSWGCWIHDLDTGEKLPINAFLSLLPLSISFFATRHLPTPKHVLFTPSQHEHYRAGIPLGTRRGVT